MHFRRRLLAPASFVLAGLVAACSGSNDTSGAGGSGGAANVGDGMPCDIVNILENHCQACHSSKPHGAPMPLVTYEDLTAMSPKGVTYAALCDQRMNDATKPMPPDAMITIPQAERDAFAAWVKAGTPHGACGGSAAASTATTSGATP